ncbi:MAG: hypothetical protein ACE5G5_04860, partial [Candidatus Methylomirabilales bacterium]
MRSPKMVRTNFAPFRSLLFMGLAAALSACAGPQAHAEMKAHGMKAQMKELQQLAPARGYLDAHKGVQEPFGLLGGPITVTITQNSGGVFVALPDNRRLDKNVFG